MWRLRYERASSDGFTGTPQTNCLFASLGASNRLTVETRSIRSGWSGWSSPGSCSLYTALAETPPLSETRNHGTICQTEHKANTLQRLKLKITCSRRDSHCLHTYTCFSRGRAGSTLSPTMWPSCGIRNFIPPPASGLDLGPGGRNRSVGEEDRSHSAPSNCTVGQKKKQTKKIH